MSSNTILTIITILVGIALILVIYLRFKHEKSDIIEKTSMTFEDLLDIVKAEINEMVSQEIAYDGNDAEINSLLRSKVRMQSALDDCGFGMESAKDIVKGLIKSIIARVLPTEDEICSILNFRGRYIEPRIKFEILMYFYKKEYKAKALAQMLTEYELHKERYIAEDKTRPSFGVEADDIDRIYSEKNYVIDYEVMLDMLTVLIFQRYKGFGILDTINEMDINGYNCGTSGSIMTHLRKGKNRTEWTAPRSIWLFLDGKFLHLRFLSFGTEEELKRVIQLMIRYNKPGPLTEKRGFLVNTMQNKSRIVAIRPPVSEYWCVFVRKFTLVDVKVPNLLLKQVVPEMRMIPSIEAQLRKDYKMSDEDIERVAKSYTENNPRLIEDLLMAGFNIPGYVKNGHIPVKLLKYIMIGRITTAFTGRQGSGKTTLMGAAIEYVDLRLTIRILEMAFELYAREAYPERNIVTAQETQYVTASEVQGVFKKTDGALSLVGEVATDEIAARMIQFAQIASVFTMFSHHANRVQDLVAGIRNSLCAANNFDNMHIAEQQVLEVLKLDVHMEYNTATGYRYIERISEVIKLDEGEDYPGFDGNDAFGSFAKASIEYYRRSTDRKTFESRDILRYDYTTHTYVPCERFSDETIETMMKNMTEKESQEFAEFLLTYWPEVEVAA